MPTILAAANPDLGGAIRLLLVLSTLSLGVGAWLGVIRLREVTGPTRLADGRRIWPLFVSLLLGFSVWIGAQIVYVGWRQSQLSAATSATNPAAFDATQYTPADWAWMACVPPLLAAMMLVAVNCTIAVNGVRPGWRALQRLGLRRFGSALWMGAIGMTLALPIVLLALNASEWVYEHVGYEHPMEHDLLRMMAEQSSIAIRVALVLGATIAAPVFEELLFRGHLQTLIRALLLRIPERAPSRGFALDTPSLKLDEESSLPQQNPAERQPAVWQSWVAILVVSAMFALVHPQWMRPAIFCLAICFGFAYERTGNLWVSIVMHAAFNSLETVWFLMHQPIG